MGAISFVVMAIPPKQSLPRKKVFVLCQGVIPVEAVSFVVVLPHKQTNKQTNKQSRRKRECVIYYAKCDTNRSDYICDGSTS